MRLLDSPGKIFVSVLGVFVLLVGGFFWYLAGVPADSSDHILTTQDTEAVARDTDQNIFVEDPNDLAHAADLNIFKTALKNKDESICHQIAEFALRDSCFNRVRFTVALGIEEIELCTLITDEDLKTECWNTVMIRKAVAAKNSTLCAQISRPEAYAQCISQIDNEFSQGASNPAECEQISVLETRKECVDTFRLQELRKTGNMEACAQLLTTKVQTECRDYFISKNAVSASDPTLCFQVSSVVERRNCEESVKVLLKKDQYSRGVLEGKSSYCADFLDAELKTACENEANYYAARKYRDTNYCGKIANDLDFQTRCYAELTVLNDEYWLSKAREQNSPALCGNITTSSAQEYCRALF